MVNYFNAVLNLFIEMAPYLLLGFIFSGILRWVFKDQIITKYLGTSSLKSISLASIFGVPLPLCSCGVVPAGISLKRQGASKASTLSFLTSTPQTGVDSILVTYGFLGPVFTIYKVLVSFFMGITAGLLSRKLEPSESSNNEEISAHAVSEVKSFKEFLEYSFVELVDAIKDWLLIGLLIAALISSFLPVEVASQISSYLGTFGQYLVVLLIATPMYVCSTASVPIAVSLIMKGFPLGTAMVFLIAGPATNAATISILWKNLGKKSIIAYLGNILILSILFGYLFDRFFPNAMEGFVSSGEGHHHAFGLIDYGSAVILGLLILNTYVMQWKAKIAAPATTSSDKLQKVNITGMTCGGCVKKATSLLSELDGIEEVHVGLNQPTEIKYKTNPIAVDDLQKALDPAGYTVTKL